MLLIVLVSTTDFLKKNYVKLTLVLRSGPAGLWLAAALRPRGHSQHAALCEARGGGGGGSGRGQQWYAGRQQEHVAGAQIPVARGIGSVLVVTNCAEK